MKMEARISLNVNNLNNLKNRLQQLINELRAVYLNIDEIDPDFMQLIFTLYDEIRFVKDNIIPQ